MQLDAYLNYDLGYSGADLAALVREAGLAVLQEWRQNFPQTNKITTNWAIIADDNKDNSSISVPRIGSRHFDTAFSRVHPSVSAEDRLRYSSVFDLKIFSLTLDKARKGALFN